MQYSLMLYLAVLSSGNRVVVDFFLGPGWVVGHGVDHPEAGGLVEHDDPFGMPYLMCVSYQGLLTEETQPLYSTHTSNN